MGKITEHLQKCRSEKQKKFWKNAIMNGEYYNDYYGEWMQIPQTALAMFTNEEIHMIYIERDHQTQELKKLMEQLE